MNVNTVYINGKQVGQCTYAQIRPTVGSKSVPENYDIELIKFVSVQPQLNENQQQVLGWLKDYYKENRPFTTAFGAIRNVASKRWAFIKQNLTEDQQEHVLEVFSRWALEQEEE